MWSCSLSPANALQLAEGRGGVDQELGVSVYTLLYIKW